jgi:hypothetical protein
LEAAAGAMDLEYSGLPRDKLDVSGLAELSLLPK